MSRSAVLNCDRRIARELSGSRRDPPKASRQNIRAGPVSNSLCLRSRAILYVNLRHYGYQRTRLPSQVRSVLCARSPGGRSALSKVQNALDTCELRVIRHAIFGRRFLITMCQVKAARASLLVSRRFGEAVKRRRTACPVAQTGGGKKLGASDTAASSRTRERHRSIALKYSDTVFRRRSSLTRAKELSGD
jgi:hypothetical protein